MEFLISLLAKLLGSVLGRQVTAELKAWTPWIVERLVSHAIARLPEDQRPRYKEEWRAHVNEVPGEVGKICVVFGFLLAARKMRAEREELLSSDLLKRAFDAIVSTYCLVSMLPLLAFAYLMIRLSHSGPVLCREEYIGRHGRKFSVYRFGGFVPKNERAGTRPPLPGLARIGKLLRLDRFGFLPMILNVLRGDMSLVGPYPLQHEEDRLLAQAVPNHAERRRRVRPGLIGLAQLSKHSNLSAEVAYDLYYIEHRSFKLDLLILLRFISRSLVGRNSRS